MTSATMCNNYRRSSKTRRKAERKKLSLREGSAHEEEALMEAMGKIVLTVDSLQDDMRTFLPTLVQFGYTKEASMVQRSYAELLDCVKLRMESIWPGGSSGVAATVAPTDMQVYTGLPVCHTYILLLIFHRGV